MDTYTVRELRQYLEGLDDDMPVLIDEGTWWTEISNVELQTFEYDEEKYAIIALSMGEAYSKPMEKGE